MSHASYLSTPLIGGALLLDLFFGDPEWLPHPIRAIGAAISYGERALHTGDSTRDFRNGAMLTAIVLVLSAAVVWAAIALCDRVSSTLGAVVATAIAWTTLAAHGLDAAAAAVQQSLLQRDLGAARCAIPTLVGRDPSSLSREEMIRATVESVAENSSDGVIAPLMFLFVGGPVGAMAYKAINTLDSMIGHRDERYDYFGRAAARLDDVANWVPARFTALCIVAASEIWLRRAREAFAICRRDARKHESPNSGWPEAAMAGGLGIQLGGAATYAGEKIERALIGEPECPATIDDIASARNILRIATAVAFLLLAIFRALIA